MFPFSWNAFLDFDSTGGASILMGVDSGIFCSSGSGLAETREQSSSRGLGSKAVLGYCKALGGGLFDRKSLITGGN